MRIHAVQFDIAWHDGAENVRRIEALLSDVSVAQGDVVVLPEMAACGFTSDVAGAAEESERLERYCASWARETKAHYIAGLVRAEPSGQGRNLAVLLQASGEAAHYQKVHPFCGFEQANYVAGRDVVQWSIEGWPVRPAICYDLRFPELFRTGDPTERPELIVVIASWPSPRIAHWSALLRARAIENQCYVVGVNRTGRDPNAEYVGRSAIFNPSGETIAEADDRPRVLSATLDRDEVRRLRTALPFQPDQRLRVLP